MSTSTSSDNAVEQSTQPKHQLICVKRPETSLNAVFEHMYLNERLVDVTLCCSNGQLQAHKLVLAACSQYFSDLFDKLINPFHYPVVVIKDMQIEDLRLLVEYMYRGKITINQDKVSDFVKCAENLRITGLSSLDSLITSPVGKSDDSNTVTINVEGPKSSTPASPSSKLKRTKRSTSTFLNQGMFVRTYQRNIQDEEDLDDQPSPAHLMEQSLVTTNDTLDVSSQFNTTTYALTANSGHLTSTKNLIASNSLPNHGTNHHQLHTNPVSSLHHIQHQLAIDHQSSSHHQHSNHSLTNQLQVLSHSLAANRSSISAHGTSSISNGQLGNHMSATNHSSTSSTVRGRLHPCNICWKTFREKANLKRHLQVHSLDRVVYACPDCNKTFSWKDNYIRHTKTAHHMNNVTRQQAN